MDEQISQTIKYQPRFNGIFEDHEGFHRQINLTSVSHGNNSYHASNSDHDLIHELESEISDYLGAPYVVATRSGEVAMHLALMLAVRKAYNSDTLSGNRVFCSDLCPVDEATSILNMNGTPTFIDVTDYDFNINPECLEIAFDTYPDTRIVILDHYHGFPGTVTEIKEICKTHGALLIENASDSIGAKVDGRYTGTFGDIAVLDFGKDKIISGESGGMILLQDEADYDMVRTWIDSSKNGSSNITMSHASAALILEQLPNIEEIISEKKRIYDMYQENLNQDLISMIDYNENVEPNYWLSVVMCDSVVSATEHEPQHESIIIDEDIYADRHGISSPKEISEVLKAFGAQACAVPKAMSLRPAFKDFELITLDGAISCFQLADCENDLLFEAMSRDVSNKCICLPADLSMTEEEQSKVIELIHSCFSRSDIDRKEYTVVV